MKAEYNHTKQIEKENRVHSYMNVHSLEQSTRQTDLMIYLSNQQLYSL